MDKSIKVNITHKRNTTPFLDRQFHMPIHLLEALASTGHPGSPALAAWPGEDILSGHGGNTPIPVVVRKERTLKRAVSGCC